MTERHRSLVEDSTETCFLVDVFDAGILFWQVGFSRDCDGLEKPWICDAADMKEGEESEEEGEEVEEVRDWGVQKALDCLKESHPVRMVMAAIDEAVRELGFKSDHLAESVLRKLTGDKLFMSMVSDDESAHLKADGKRLFEFIES